ncbi:FAD-dependent oxidoreductase [Motilimonas eburnea]|uniref:FAD-dependent oxidoreductase n=1 Tax=Motilimonas eburnea TaxID=1737488 RepID=UPI001E52438A|nr:FAD-dependent oxidoreductase [Motilimonas eburnea]MCE2570727.1 FAD-binding oxidoreductase [Motilimonas eburnea]
MANHIADNTSHLATVGIIGAGVAGSTIALRLAELGIKTLLIERGDGLVNGPPMCHLHAGGNLYREISDQQCLKLLKQSIETLRIYPHCVNQRPTVIAVPTQDPGDPSDLMPRLHLLRDEYQRIVAADPLNQVLGQPENYFTLYQREDLDRLALCPTPVQPSSNDDWMIPIAKQVDLDKLKFPLVLVQEYGLSSLRIAATASLALAQLECAQVLTNTQVTQVTPNQDGWLIESQGKQGVQQYQVDYLVNACGFRTGSVDDMAKFSRQRMVEFKAAYIARWPEPNAVWPEVIFHGQRGTPKGMAQLTPYCDGHFQLHGMTKDITLFNGGLVHSSTASSQPKLPDALVNKIIHQWPMDVLKQRTEQAVDHVSQFVPSFASAEFGGKPLYGAQQIPGDDADLRAAAVSFEPHHYARAEIVKASSALTAADQILAKLTELDLVSPCDAAPREAQFTTTLGLAPKQITQLAMELAIARQYPPALALPYHAASSRDQAANTSGKPSYSSIHAEKSDLTRVFA